MINDIFREHRRETASLLTAFDRACPVQGVLPLSAPFEFQWPDGRTLRFTHLGLDADSFPCAILPGATERVRVRLLSVTTLRELLEKVPGAQVPALPGAENVVAFHPEEMPDRSK